MLEELKQKVYEANMLLPAYHLVTFTWGNVSGIERERGLFVIKPSGGDYEKLRPEDMVVMDLEGNKVEGSLNPSTDTPTHMELYRRFPNIGGVVHTHSRWATIWAQAGRDIPAYGTTHADSFDGPVPVTRWLGEDEVAMAYEENTGLAIAEIVDAENPLACPAALVAGHGPFAWGKDVESAFEASVALESIAHMAFVTEQLLCGPDQASPPLPAHIANKHFNRKHGVNAYYGQTHT